MTIGITGPGRNAPRQSAVVGLIVAAFFIGIGLILLELASDFLVESGSEADAINLGRDQPWRIGLEYDRAASL
jgi:hypothetical protein